MVRVKRGAVAKTRRKKILKFAKIPQKNSTRDKIFVGKILRYQKRVGEINDFFRKIYSPELMLCERTLPYLVLVHAPEIHGVQFAADQRLKAGHPLNMFYP